MTLPPVLAVVGATASGKSELGLDLAEVLGGEIVNTDAMQVYRGMDVGTAKLPPDRRRGIPHHLLDVLDVDQEANVATFQRMAREAIDDVRGRGRVPVLVGGSALYTRAVVDRLEFPGTDPEIRARLEAELADAGAAQLHQRLQGVDPAAASGIEPTNGRRIVRALEVVEIEGRFEPRLPDPEYVYPGTVQVGVDIDRPTLDVRIEARVEQMWRDGLVAEVRSLRSPSRTASRALGYAQVLEHLSGATSEQEAKERTVVRTRRFARRQDAWFRKDPRVAWVAYDDPDRVARALDLL